MALIKEYTTPEGTTIQFFDDNFKDKTEEELRAADENVIKVAQQLYREYVESKMQNALVG